MTSKLQIYADPDYSNENYLYHKFCTYKLITIWLNSYTTQLLVQTHPQPLPPNPPLSIPLIIHPSYYKHKAGTVFEI